MLRVALSAQALRVIVHLEITRLGLSRVVGVSSNILRASEMRAPYMLVLSTETVTG